MTPFEFESLLELIDTKLSGVRGWFTKRDVSMLATLAACPTAEGEILEIGTYRGRSTIVLCLGSEKSDLAAITAVDILGEDPDSIKEAEQELTSNLKTAGVLDRIDLKVMSSQDFLPEMKKNLRLLWIDGDHSYEGSTFDIREFSKFIVDRGIIACHDILSPFGCTQSFKELVVENPHFGPIGFCGSIGWAQFHENADDALPFSKQKQILSRRLAPLCRLTSKARASKIHRKIYRFHKSRIPHGFISPSNWILNIS